MSTLTEKIRMARLNDLKCFCCKALVDDMNEDTYIFMKDVGYVCRKHHGIPKLNKPVVAPVAPVAPVVPAVPVIVSEKKSKKAIERAKEVEKKAQKNLEKQRKAQEKQAKKNKKVVEE